MMASTPKTIEVDVEGYGRLDAMFEMQDRFEELCVGFRFSADLDDEMRIAQFKEMKLAIESELQEAMDEMGWKPWASSKHFNRDAVQNELVDAWHFFMCMCLLAGMNPATLYEKYVAKISVNIDRQLQGYDGVSTKCPECKRALDDSNTLCNPELHYCMNKG